MYLVYIIAPGGGPEAYVKTISPWLRDHGHRVSVVYTVDSTRVQLPVVADAVVYAPSRSWHYYLAKVVGDWRALPRRLRQWESAQAAYAVLKRIQIEHPIDLVEVIEGLPIGRLRKHWHVVVRAHGSAWTFRHFCEDDECWTDSWLIAAQAKQFSEAHGVTALSRHLAQHLSEKLGFPLQKIQVIPYPIDVDQFRPAEPRRTVPSPSLLTIGRLEKRKGTDILMRALNCVWDSYPDLKVTLLGVEGDLTRQNLLAMIPADKHPQIVFQGFVDRICLPEFYQKASIYVAPTMYETFGYTILEAMACGVPVIAADVGALSELVANNATGLLVPFGNVNALANAILALLGDTERSDSLGKRGHRNASKYSLEPMMQVNLDFYQNALKNDLAR